MCYRRGALLFLRVICQISRSHRTEKQILTRFGRFWTVTPVWIDRRLCKDHNAWSSIEEVPDYLSRSFVKSQIHTGQNNRQFLLELSVSGLFIQFEFTDGFEIIPNAWYSIEQVPYFLRGHPLDMKVIRAEISTIWILCLDNIEWYDWVGQTHYRCQLWGTLIIRLYSWY